MHTAPDVEFDLPAQALEREAMQIAIDGLVELFSDASGDDSALFVVSRNAGNASAERFWADAQRSGVALASPELFPWCLANAPCGALARRFGITGPNCTWLGGDDALHSAHAAAAAALGDGRVERAYVVAVEFGSPTSGRGRLQAWLVRSRSCRLHRSWWAVAPAGGVRNTCSLVPEECDVSTAADDGDTRALTATLAAAERGDVAATEALFALLYRELHRLARRQLHANASGLTLGATTLLHEAYLDLSQRGLAFPDRARFFAYAARAMRGLIIDYVRERRAIKRGGEFHLTTLDTEAAESALPADDLAPLGDALDALAASDPALAELVELKFFCGFGFAEIAAMRGVSERTVQRDWAKARLFLRYTMRDDVESK